MATLARVGAHVSPITGAVKSVDSVFADNEGVMHAYTAGHNFAVQYDGLAFLRRSLRVRSGGKGPTDADARVGAICEALERYSGVYRGDESSVRGRYSDLGDEAIHPNDVMGFSERQYRDRGGSTRQQGSHRSSPLVPLPFEVDARIARRCGRRPTQSRLLPRAGVLHYARTTLSRAWTLLSQTPTGTRRLVPEDAAIKACSS